MALDSSGRYQPQASSAEAFATRSGIPLSEVCPFSDPGPHENEIAAEFFSKTCSFHPAIGCYLSTHVGHVTESDQRLNSSSGGIITWLGSILLRNGLVDGIIHVASRPRCRDRAPLFAYTISRNIDELRRGSKSKYYPVELSEVLLAVSNTPGRYAVIGIPCFIKALRRLCRFDTVIHKRLSYFIGLVCGHLKSAHFTDLLASQMNVPIDQLSLFDFRVKIPGRSASGYGVRAMGGPHDKTSPISSLFGTDWGLHLFRYGACYFCDDLFSETADVAVGDAWLHPYDSDWMGNSVIVIRHPLFADLLQHGMNSGELAVEALPPESVVFSQSGGLRDRREDILWRIALRRRKGVWHPHKRDFGHELPGFRRRLLIMTRMRLRTASFAAWSEPRVHGRPRAFKAALRPLLLCYQLQTRGMPRTLTALFRAFLRNAMNSIRSLFALHAQ